MATEMFIPFEATQRALIPETFAPATSKIPTIEEADLDHNGSLYYHIVWDVDLTNDERSLAYMVAQGNANTDALINAAKAAYLDNQGWVANTYPQVVSGVNTIKNSGTSSTFDKSLADGIKTLADQLLDVCNQNKALIKMALGLTDNPLT